MFTVTFFKIKWASTILIIEIFEYEACGVVD
jgi:hypothetical protein